MNKISSFKFSRDQFDLIKHYRFGHDWPVVYIIEDGKEAYIGETISVFNRSKQHYDRDERRKLTDIHVITDEDYNKSAALDIESWLIQYMLADGTFKLQNSNGGLKNHSYYDREKYEAKFDLVWKQLKKMSLVQKDLLEIKNSDLFKYSPYKSLTEDQETFVEHLLYDLENDVSNTYIVNGGPGTGKTILATYLVKFLQEHSKGKDMNIGLVIPMVSLRKTLRQVFRSIKGLKSNMVIGPGDVVKKKYDLLIVDEAHRLKRRRNIVNYASFDKTNKLLNLDKDGTELDWVLLSSDKQIFFYDKNQSVKPSDIPASKFENLKAASYELETQLRVKGGGGFIEFIDSLFEQKPIKSLDFTDYDFKFYNDVALMVGDIKQKDKEHELSRIVAGYAWEWHTNPKKNSSQDYDIDINGTQLKWNSTTEGWVTSSNAINEVGCIHTIQGYDLNYVGVIIGPELSYDPNTKQLIVKREHYKDKNGVAGITDPEELKRYVINIYKTLLTRGIHGAYMYVVDEDLREYFKNVLSL